MTARYRPTDAPPIHEPPLQPSPDLHRSAPSFRACAEETGPSSETIDLAGNRITTSDLQEPQPRPATLAFTLSLLAPAGALAAWMLLDHLFTRRMTAVGAATGIVVGLVAVTPAAGFVGPMSALAIGALAALPSYLAIMKRSRTRLDDSIEVAAAHGLGSMTGAVLTGVFAAT